MCYMAIAQAGEVAVGVRELRQNLSVYLEQVARGTVFRVTDRGRAVALLVPLRENATTADRLVASGRAAAARHDVLALGRPLSHRGSPVSVALRETRGDRL
jgi:prevent-host-death family protein